MKKGFLRALSLGTGALAICVPAMKASADADVALCNLHQVTKWGTAGDITAYSIGTTSVNVGTSNLDWIQNGTNHPVIGQNMYKLENGRFEQIGQSWLKHSFCALQIDSGCSSGCPNTAGCLDYLAPGCQDPYSAPRNGSQGLLGPKWQVDAHEGTFTWPHPTPGSGTIAGRLQVHNADLGDADALDFIDGQYVARDDSLAGNQNNNASHRMVSISAAPAYNIGFVGGQSTVFGRQAIYAWQMHGLGMNQPDLEVDIDRVQVPGEGLFIVGDKVSDNGDGTWHYEYAIQNVNSHRSGGLFSVPIGAGVTVTNVGFRDVDYHSGDGVGGITYDGTDWQWSIDGGAISWATETEAENSNANALRWGTLYNFRFDADSGPETSTATIGLYRAGSPDAVTVEVRAPEAIEETCVWDCGDPADGDVGVLDFLALLAQWGQVGASCDIDGGGVGVTDFLALLANWGPCP
jgi:hypothetical protein